jgi:hypothetical protein
MSLLTVEEALTEPLVRRIGRAIVADLMAIGLVERWVPRGRYASHYGVTPKTVYVRTPYLRSLGAAMNDGKLTRYDITVSPSGERLLKS